MSAGLAYVAAFSLASGAGIAAFWAGAAARGRMERLAAGRRDFSWHVAAELATAALLLAGGTATVASPDAAWTGTLSSLALGALVYSLVSSPGHYLAAGERATAALLAATWLGLVPAIVLRLAA